MIASVTFQSLLLVIAQLLLKIALKQFGTFNWSWNYFKSVLFNPIFFLAGISAVSATLLWMYILKKYDFSLVYPLTSVCYIFGIMASQWILHETIPATRWIGVGIIVIGVFFVVK